MSLLIVLAASVALAITEAYEERLYSQYRGPPAPLTSDGMVMDTPEVANARAAHLALHAETMARLRKAENEYEAYENNEAPYMTRVMDPMETVMMKRQRQRSYMPVERSTENPEMADARTSLLAAHTRAASKASEFYEFDVFGGRKNLLYLAPVRIAYKHAPSMGYRGPLAPLGPDGRVIDTPEVMRAREEHMKAHARALALSQNDLYY